MAMIKLITSFNALLLPKDRSVQDIMEGRRPVTHNLEVSRSWYSRLPDSFTSLESRNVSHALISNHPAHSTIRVLEHMKLRPWYPDQNIFYGDDIEAVPVDASADLKDVFLVDVDADHLLKAKSLGMSTAFVTSGSAITQRLFEAFTYVNGTADLFLQQHLARMPRVKSDIQAPAP